MKRGLAIASALAAGPWVVGAAVPALESVYPAGARQGTEIGLTFLGKFEPWPCEVWFSAPGLTFTPDPEKAGAGKLQVGASVPSGPVLVRVHNAEGASAPRIFIVGTKPEILDEEKDGNTIAGAAPLDRASLPLVVNGTLAGGGELDAWRLRLEKGETLHARVEAYGLRSPLDPALHVHDAAGHRLALVHDGPTNLDPALIFTAPETGDYVVSLAGFSHPPATSVAYVGSKNSHYRLHLAWKAGDLPAHLVPRDPGADNPETKLSPGQSLVATLKEAQTPNRHPIEVKKGDKLLVRVEGRALRYPIDPVLRILKPDGGEIRREDDTGKSSDPEYLWTAAEDGIHTLEVSDRFGRGGADLRYRLGAAPPAPDFKLVADKGLYPMERGKPLEVKLKLTRLHGHAGELALSASGLPDSIVASPPDKTPEKDGDLTLKLEAVDGAPAFSGPVRVVARERKESDGALERIALFSFVDDNWRGPYAIDEFPELWLVLPPAKEEKKEEKEDGKEKAK